MVGLILTNYSKLPLARSNGAIQTPPRLPCASQRAVAPTQRTGALFRQFPDTVIRRNLFFVPRARSVLHHSWKKFSLGACPLCSYQKLLLLAMMIRQVLTSGELLNSAHPLTLFEEKVASSRWRGANKHSALYPSERSPSVRWPDPPGSSSGTDWSEEESVKRTRLPCYHVFSLI